MQLRVIEKLSAKANFLTSQDICRYFSHYPLYFSAELRLWWKFSAELTSWKFWAELFWRNSSGEHPKILRARWISCETKTSEFYSLRSAQRFDSVRRCTTKCSDLWGKFLRITRDLQKISHNPSFFSGTKAGEFSADLTLRLKFSAERNLLWKFSAELPSFLRIRWISCERKILEIL